MKLAFRALEPADFEAVASISRRSGEGHVDAETLLNEERAFDRTRFDRIHLVATDEEGVVVGRAIGTHVPSRFEPGRYFVGIEVDPRLRRRGIGAAMWSELAARLAERRAQLACVWCEDGTAGASFVQIRGFVEVIRAYEQVVAVARAPLPTGAAEERLAAAGIRIATLAELMAVDSDAALRAAFELHTEARLDQPTLGRVTAAPYGDWLAYNVEAPEALTDAYLVALDQDRHVGTCSIRREDEDSARIGITAVLPSHRRLGIARALKLRAHEIAKAKGYREIRTSNTAPNKGMLALNDALGYVIVSSRGGYELELVSPPPRGC